MGIPKNQIKTLQIISVLVVLLLISLSALTCINVYKESNGYSQMPIEDTENINEPTIYENSHNNQFLRVTIIGVIEIVLIIVTCFKLSIASAIIELLLTIGTLCLGYLEQLMASIVGGVGSPMYTVTFEIKTAGYFVVFVAIINVIMTIVMAIKKNAFVKGEGENAINNNTDWS